MQEQDQPTKLSNLQLELLKIFSRNLPDEELLEIRSLLSHYFAQKVDKEFEKLEKERGWTAETYDQWAKEHMRTPYKK
jgi:hypothetical protein